MSSAAISQHSSSLFITNLSWFLSPDPTLSCRLTSRPPLMSHMSQRGCLDWFKQVVCMHGAALSDTNVCVCVELHPAELPVFVWDKILQSFYLIIMCQCDDYVFLSTGPAVI